MNYPAGWTCQRTSQHFESYLLGSLVLVEALAVAEHVEACDGCAQRLVLVRLTLIEHTHG